MLENTNDYMSVITVILVLRAMLGVALHVLSLRATAKHLRQEADYYSLKKDLKK